MRIAKGWRKVIVLESVLLWAILVGIIFKSQPDVLVPLCSLAGVGLTIFGAANYGEHREDKVERL
jgi:hypothetical protein